jgi:hypothetical protein
VTDADGDRFNAATYADDACVHIFRCDRYAPFEEGELWVAERLWKRIRCIGQGYELHLTPLLDGSTDPVFLNGTQVVQFESELMFIAELMDDPLLASLIGLLIGLLRLESQGASKDAVGFEFP